MSGPFATQGSYSKISGRRSGVTVTLHTVNPKVLSFSIR